MSLRLHEFTGPPPPLGLKPTRSVRLLTGNEPAEEESVANVDTEKKAKKAEYMRKWWAKKRAKDGRNLKPKLQPETAKVAANNCKPAPKNAANNCKFAVWEDGSVEIRRGDYGIELSKAEALRLAEFIARKS